MEGSYHLLCAAIIEPRKIYVRLMLGLYPLIEAARSSITCSVIQKKKKYGAFAVAVRLSHATVHKTAVEVGDWIRDKATQKHIVIWTQVCSWKFFILSILQKKGQSLIDEFL